MSCECQKSGFNCSTPFETQLPIGFKRFPEGRCFSQADFAMNLFNQIGGLIEGLKYLADAHKERGFASAALVNRAPNFNTQHGQSREFLFSRAPFNYKVTGFGASVPELKGFDGYDDEGSLGVELWNFTNAQMISSLYINKNALAVNVNESGSPIGINIGAGHQYGIITRYNNDGNFNTLPINQLDIYIHVEPQELVTQEV